MTVPLHIETVPSNPIQRYERTVELIIHPVGEAGTVALDHAMLGAALSAEDIDGVVELGRPDLGKNRGVMKSVTSRSHGVVTEIRR